MRAAERIHVVVFSFLVVLAWLRLLPPRRLKVTAIGIAALAVTLFSAYELPLLLAPLPVSVIRDWLPASLVLLVYWQAGEFFAGPNQPFQDRLERLDEHIAGPLLRWVARRRARTWIAAALELAYVLCYPMIPMSMGTLYVLRAARNADYFWTVVLIATYSSYCLLPFLQSLPPRMFKEPWLTPLPHNPIRALNLYLLRHASIHANTFPSAHVAASAAAALVILPLAPWPIGALFAAIATGIAFGTFAGRYHYAADSITGVAVALLVFLAKAAVSGLPR
ncbi:MAG TPA: phosphatase PAP2 family protein [Candidatus Acidoferrales bacterium]|nr:phosphatase PAP2 family protein [Candidatus Acidoferrales bacterium]